MTYSPPYDNLQPVLTEPEPFHTVMIDIINGLPTTRTTFGTLMAIADKFTMHIGLVPTLEAKQTGPDNSGSILFYSSKVLVVRQLGPPVSIMSNRDKKFNFFSKDSGKR